MKTWKVSSGKLVYKNPFFAVNEEKVQTHTGQDLTYFTIKMRPYVTVLPVEGEKMLFVEEYRVGIKNLTLEVPGGGVEAGQTHLEAAKTELVEETGYQASSWELLGKYYLAADWIGQECFVYSATNLKQVQKETKEDLDTYWYPLPKVRRMLSEGKFVDCDTVAGLGLFFAKKGTV